MNIGCITCLQTASKMRHFNGDGLDACAYAWRCGQVYAYVMRDLRKCMCASTTQSAYHRGGGPGTCTRKEHTDADSGCGLSPRQRNFWNHSSLLYILYSILSKYASSIQASLLIVYRSSYSLSVLP
jgi:hypothetical protein